MTPRRPPRLALLLLRWLGSDREALAGDLVEELERGRSRFWFWRQVLAAAVTDVPRARTPIDLGLSDEPVVHPTRLPRVNPSGTATHLVGSVGVLGIAFVASLVRGFTWFVLILITAGILLGVIAILVKHRRRAA